MDSIVSFFIIILLEIEPYIELCFLKMFKLYRCVFRGLFPNFMRPFRKSNYKCLICSLYVLGGCCRFKNVFNQFSPTYIFSCFLFVFQSQVQIDSEGNIYNHRARRECKKIFGCIKCYYVKGKEGKKS